MALSDRMLGWVVEKRWLVHRLVAWRRPLLVLAVFLLLAGVLGFVGMPAMLNWLPESVERPIGYCDDIITMPDGKNVVASVWVSRVQVYDARWHYITGWRAPTGGGFLVEPLANGDIEAVMVREHEIVTYPPDGKTIKARTSYPPADWARYQRPGRSGWVPTPWWLLFFTTPLIPFGMLSVGMLIAGFMEYLLIREKQDL